MQETTIKNEAATIGHKLLSEVKDSLRNFIGAGEGLKVNLNVINKFYIICFLNCVII